MKKLIIPGLLLVTALALLVTGIAAINNQESKPAVQNNAPATPRQSLEDFLKRNNARGEVAQAYKFALENPQNVLSIVKCYCGCMQNQGHRNNKDCFINDDGTFDLMGLNCGLCVKTALTAKQMLADGKSVQEISDYVDVHWGKN